MSKSKSYAAKIAEETPVAPPEAPKKPQGYKILQHLKFNGRILEPGSVNALNGLTADAIANLKQAGVIE